jgi:hypothetical protein
MDLPTRIQALTETVVADSQRDVAHARLTRALRRR